MGVESSRAPRRLLLVVLLVAGASCRFGYETLALDPAGLAGAGGQAAGGLAGNSDGGTLGAGGNTMPAGGDATPAGGGALPNAGSDPLGSSGSGGGAPLAGSPGAGGSPLALGGAGGDGGAGGASGAGGDGNPVTTCANTPDCTCATLPQVSYWFCEQSLNQSDAQAHCATQSMHLVRIDTLVENSFLRTTANALAVFDVNGFALIGANDRDVAGEWRWLDGTLFWQGGAQGSAAGGLFSKWAPANPSASGPEQCAVLVDSGDWQDSDCSVPLPFICESP